MFMFGVVLTQQVVSNSAAVHDIAPKKTKLLPRVLLFCMITYLIIIIKVDTVAIKHIHNIYYS